MNASVYVGGRVFGFDLPSDKTDSGPPKAVRAAAITAAAVVVGMALIKAVKPRRARR
jgi:hypothetical protein